MTESDQSKLLDTIKIKTLVTNQNRKSKYLKTSLELARNNTEPSQTMRQILGNFIELIVLAGLSEDAIDFH